MAMPGPGPKEEIKLKTDIVALFSEYVQVKKTGASFMAVCPFHHEKTPSLHISPDKQMWYCHGCGEGGDIFGFIERMEGMDFKEALRFLGKKAGVAVSETDMKEDSERAMLLRTNDVAARFYHEHLLKSSGAAAARAYVAKRKLTDQMVEDFRLGYSPDGWDALLTFLKQKGVKEELAYKAGLLSKSERSRGYFDRFRNRLMFPISDRHGNVVGFTARVLPGADGKDPKDEAKYITTQTPVYNKSAVLYGFHLAKRAIKEKGVAVVVEGNMDVIASHQGGVKNIVASSGTSFTDEQLRILKNVTDRLVLSFDNDAAGENAARRSIDAAVAAGFAVRVLRLPNGLKDPDDAVKKDPAIWAKAIADAVPYMEWYIDLVRERTDMTNPDAVRDASQSLLKEIAKLAAPAERSHWIRPVAELFHTPESALFEAVQKAVTHKTPVAAPAPAAKPAAPAVPRAKSRDSIVSQHILALIFAYAPLAEPVANVIRPEMMSEEFRELYRDFVIAYTAERRSGREITTYHALAQRASDRESADRVAFLELLAEKEYGDKSDDARRDVLVTLIGELKSLHKGRRQKELTHAMLAAEKAGDAAKIHEIEEQLNELIV
jgi:DNA primase